jgi:hypothetical protein
MKSPKKIVKGKAERPEREKVSREEALKHVKSFPKRRQNLVASIKDVSRRNTRSSD